MKVSIRLFDLFTGKGQFDDLDFSFIRVRTAARLQQITNKRTQGAESEEIDREFEEIGTTN